MEETIGIVDITDTTVTAGEVGVVGEATTETAGEVDMTPGVVTMVVTTIALDIPTITSVNDVARQRLDSNLALPTDGTVGPVVVVIPRRLSKQQEPSGRLLLTMSR